jgi:hypothetical protein
LLAEEAGALWAAHNLAQLRTVEEMVDHLVSLKMAQQTPAVAEVAGATKATICLAARAAQEL